MRSRTRGTSVFRLPPPAARGFTLLEVLVALAVLALALGTLIQAGSRQAASLDHLRAHTFAQWVAADRIAEVRLETPWPETGTRRGSTHLGRLEWHWTLEVEGTEDPEMRRMQVTVRADPDDPDPVATLVGYAGRH